MITISTVTSLNRETYTQLLALWDEAGISNPARSDSFEAINLSLSKGGTVLTATEGENLLGSAWLTHDFRRLYVHHMAVMPKHQNKGIGASLITKALEIAHSLGYQAKLEVHKDNPSARHLYSKYGFTELDGYINMIKRDI